MLLSCPEKSVYHHNPPPPSAPQDWLVLLGFDLVVRWERLPQVLANRQAVLPVLQSLLHLFLQDEAPREAQVKAAAGNKGEGLLVPDGPQPLLPPLEDLGADLWRAVCNAEGYLGLQDLEATEVQGPTLQGERGLRAPGKGERTPLMLSPARPPPRPLPSRSVAPGLWLWGGSCC